MLRAQNVSYAVGGKYLLHPTSVAFEEGRFHVIMGANGAGKSTLLKLLAGDQPPGSGKIELAGKGLPYYTKQELATQRAVLSQHYHLTFPILVEDLVMMGRYPYFSIHPTAQDRAICKAALELMNIEALAGRDYQTLSGGEAQKVQMSRVLAQIWEAREGAAKVLFLDEPVSHLDVKYQYQLLQVAKELCQQQTTVVAILHDINLALSFADRLLLMKGGNILYDLDAPSTITTAILRDVFDVAATIVAHHHKPFVIF